MNEEQAKEYARTFKVWIGQNKTKCLVLATLAFAAGALIF